MKQQSAKSYLHRKFNNSIDSYCSDCYHGGNARSNRRNLWRIVVYQQNGSATLLWQSRLALGKQTPYSRRVSDILATVKQHTCIRRGIPMAQFGVGGWTKRRHSNPSFLLLKAATRQIQWSASTNFSTMGLITDAANTAIYQLQSVNFTGTNTTQLGSTGDGQPAWNQSPGGTTSDNTVTFTNFGPLVCGLRTQPTTTPVLVAH